MKIDDLVIDLKKQFPIFETECDEEDDIYLIYGAFGSFMLDVINLYMLDDRAPKNYFNCDVKGLYKNKDLLEKEINNFFSYIDKLFNYGENNVIDILNTCVFEALMGNDYSYNLARKFLSKETYNHYLEIPKRVL